MQIDLPSPGISTTALNIKIDACICNFLMGNGIMVRGKVVILNVHIFSKIFFEDLGNWYNLPVLLLQNIKQSVLMI